MNQAIQTGAYWDDVADDYVASAEPFTAQFCEDAVRLAEVGPGTTLLDVATGPGALALAAARAGAVVTAIDFSQAMIDRLSTRIGDLPITAARMDGRALALSDGIFDRTCSVFGIPLFPDWRAGLREMARVLRPGGRAVVAIADNPHGFGPNQLIARARAALCPDHPSPATSMRMDLVPQREQLLSEFSAAGFGEARIVERTHDFELPASSFVADHPMIAASTVLTGLSDEERIRVIEAAISDARRHSLEGQLRIPGTARFIVAEKE